MKEPLPEAGDLDSTLGVIVERAVESIAGADAGLVLLRESEGYRCGAARGYTPARGAAPARPDEPARGACLTAPIRSSGELVGYLRIESFDSTPGFPPGASDTLRLLAELAGLAVDRERLRETVRAQRQELELLASAFGHDLKAPLILIANYAAMLQRRLGQAEPEELRQVLDRLRGGVRRAEALARDLTTYLRLGHTALAIADVPLEEALDEARALLGPLIEEKRAVIESAGLPRVAADRRKLEQVLFNLLDNALKYSGELAPPRVRVEATEQEGFWRIAVRDEGPGIPVELQPALFKLFSRLPEGQRLDPAGTGVGLAVARRIVEEHRGSVGLDSRPGGGASFWFTLPR